jgi:hypothetical protein
LVLRMVRPTTLLPLAGASAAVLNTVLIAHSRAVPQKRD